MFCWTFPRKLPSGAAPDTLEPAELPELKTEKLQTACRCLLLSGYSGPPKKKGFSDPGRQGEGLKSQKGSEQETDGEGRADFREIEKQGEGEAGGLSFYRHQKGSRTDPAKRMQPPQTNRTANRSRPVFCQYNTTGQKAEARFEQRKSKE